MVWFFISTVRERERLVGFTSPSILKDALFLIGAVMGKLNSASPKISCNVLGLSPSILCYCVCCSGSSRRLRVEGREQQKRMGCQPIAEHQPKRSHEVMCNLSSSDASVALELPQDQLAVISLEWWDWGQVRVWRGGRGVMGNLSPPERRPTDSEFPFNRCLDWSGASPRWHGQACHVMLKGVGRLSYWEAMAGDFREPEDKEPKRPSSNPPPLPPSQQHSELWRDSRLTGKFLSCVLTLLRLPNGLGGGRDGPQHGTPQQFRFFPGGSRKRAKCLAPR